MSFRISAAEVDGLLLLDLLSGPDELMTEGTRAWVGDFRRFLILMRAWLVFGADSSGTLGFFCTPMLAENCPRESLLALEIMYRAFSGRLGTSTGLASHA